jgi:hypothetical protein
MFGHRHARDAGGSIRERRALHSQLLDHNAYSAAAVSCGRAIGSRDRSVGRPAKRRRARVICSRPAAPVITTSPMRRRAQRGSDAPAHGGSRR